MDLEFIHEMMEENMKGYDKIIKCMVKFKYCKIFIKVWDCSY